MIKSMQIQIIKNAVKFHFQIHKDKLVSLAEKLEAQQKKYSKPYCPCQMVRNEDTVCPCKYMRVNNSCRCGLYYKEVKK